MSDTKNIKINSLGLEVQITKRRKYREEIMVVQITKIIK